METCKRADESAYLQAALIAIGYLARAIAAPALIPKCESPVIRRARGKGDQSLIWGFISARPDRPVAARDAGSASS